MRKVLRYLARSRLACCSLRATDADAGAAAGGPSDIRAGKDRLYICCEASAPPGAAACLLWFIIFTGGLGGGFSRAS